MPDINNKKEIALFALDREREERENQALQLSLTVWLKWSETFWICFLIAFSVADFIIAVIIVGYLSVMLASNT